MQFVFDGKIYDTEKATKVFSGETCLQIYKTKRGNFFVTETSNDIEEFIGSSMDIVQDAISDVGGGVDAYRSVGIELDEA